MFNLINGIYRRPKATITLKDESLNLFSNIRSNANSHHFYSNELEVLRQEKEIKGAGAGHLL